eukprot:CAMPEP_0197826972 /NCGR_PEP_ID=MMETSP1437-20131217/3854_1 /TAXON_ID=49252 ORGANISM="Eucampia antarctica, Strain CCMP1452" /NCGR_SAMPLE_ID=MMETSP1437 /ASSEMBLY_ACC=CAM_ASM_001096 /LENGTH=712 /DNA_ID=CAMNT_0043427643 /DNA_START=58 /DNA_END=2196 /DNA_ORIENTATION=+
MMATKPKPSSSLSEDNSAVVSVPPSVEKEVSLIIPETTEEREDALKQRLAALGHVEDEELEKVESEIAEVEIAEVEKVVVEEKPSKVEPPIDLLGVTDNLSAPSLVVDETPVMEKKQAPSNNKSALLARIMAAQERAKQAQQKKTAAVADASPVTVTPTVAPPIAPPTPTVVREETNARQKMLEALSKPKQQQEPEIDLMNNFSILPPETPLMEEALPPSFDALEHMIMSQNSVTTAPVIAGEPSAPVFEELKLDTSKHLHGVVPLPPMALAPPPSFADYEQHKDNNHNNLGALMQKMKGAGESEQTATVDMDDVMQLDLDGNPMTSEERRKMMEEQRAIMEQIQNEKQANDAAIAAARADNFEERSNITSVETATSATEVIPLVPLSNQASSSERAETNRTVDIGGGQRLAVQGQERTKAAIESGTAIIVQCFSCQNWMQVTDTATLMFCPVCSVVSPVIQQTEVATKDEAMQLMKDRKLAEQLQNMEYDTQNRTSNTATNNSATEETKEVGSISEWFSSFVTPPAAKSSDNAATTSNERGATNNFESTFSSQQEKKTWWDSMTSVLNVGVASEDAKNKSRSAEVKITKPPGSTSSTAVPRSLQEARTGHEEEQANFFPENEGLLSSNTNNAQNLQPARVAGKGANPFSCVVDTVNSFGSSLATRPLTAGANGNVHGINASPLLAVPNVGRNNNTQKDNADGNYLRVPNGP